MMRKSTFLTRAAMTLLLVLFFPLWGSVGQLWADQVTASQARQQAQAFLNSRIASGNGPRHAPGVTPQLMQEKQVSGLYVFNINNNGGFIIVSNDDCALPILGYSDSGTLDPDHMPDNMRAWLQGYADEIAWAKEHGIVSVDSPATHHAAHVNKAPKADIGPLMSTKWNQGTPYNNLCPTYNSQRSATGCVATAMAQCMYYTEKRVNSTTTYTTAYIPGYTTDTRGITVAAVGSNTPIYWSRMINEYKNNSYTTEQAQAIAQLMLYCGTSVEMDYYIDDRGSSGAASYKVADALKNYFGYNATTTCVQRSFYTYANWIELMYYELSQGRVICYGGQSTGGGHEFVCDGYTFNNDTDFFHINWGWGGTSDDFFVLSALDPDVQGIGGSSSTDGYHYGQDAIIGIQKANEEGNMSDIQANTIDLSLNGTTVSNDRRVNQEITVTIDLKNNNDVLYDGDLGMRIYYLQNNSWAYYDDVSNNVLIPANSESTKIDLTFMPDRTGNYYVRVYCPNPTPGYISWVDQSQPSFEVVDAIAPTCLAVSEIEATSAKLNWQENGDATKWFVAYKTGTDANFNPIEADTNPYTLTGLMPETEYTVMVSPYSSPQYWSEQITFTTDKLAPEPTDLTVNKISHNSVLASWEGKADNYDVRYGLVPDNFTSSEAEWLKYDDGIANSLWGSSSESEQTWGVMYPGNMVTGNLLTKVSFYETSYNTGDITIRIYSGGNNAPSTLLYTAVVTPEKNGFHEVTFDTPVAITRGNNLWITLTETGTYVKVSCSSSEPNNQWIKSGNSWCNASQVGISSDDGWMIRGYIESASLNPDLVTWTNATCSGKSYAIKELAADKDYVLQVRGDYGANGKSGWETVMFTTLKLIELADDARDNSDVIDDNGETVSVILSDRTLYKDGKWNTICLPFDVTLANSPLAGATAKTLTDATMTGTHVTLTFGEAVTKLDAGVPYIIMWQSGENIVNPVFDNVIIDKTDNRISKADGQVKFIGYYDAFTINTPANDDIYYMTDDNTLKHTGKERTLKACRAYFQFSNDIVNSGRQFVLDFGEGNVVTGLENIQRVLQSQSNWYTIDGRRLEGAPTKKGLYINKNKKRIVK